MVTALLGGGLLASLCWSVFLTCEVLDLRDRVDELEDARDDEPDPGGGDDDDVDYDFDSEREAA